MAGLLEQAQDAILSMDREGRVLWGNRAAGQLLGEDGAAGLPEVLQAVLAGEAAVQRELRLTRPDGVPVDVDVSAGPVRDDTGRVIGISAVMRDVGERKRAEQALRDSEDLYRTTLGNVSDAVFITDDEGRFTFICPNVDVIFGYQHHEVEAMQRIAALLGDDHLVDPDQLARAGEIRNLERETVNKAGERRALLVHLKRVSIKGGTILHVCRDVTERKVAEEELRQQLRFEALIGGLSARFASPADGELGPAIGENLRTLGEFLAVDRVTLWEMAAEPPAFSAVDSWSADGVRPAPPLIPLERVPLIGARLASGVPFGFASTAELPAGAVAEQTFVGAEGLRSWLVIPLTIGGSLLGALSLGMLRHERAWPADLVQRLHLVGQIFGNALARQQGAAARAAARQELAHASRLAVVGELTASIAHEINQPLAAILSNAGAALRLLGPEPERLEEVRHILTDIRADDVRASDVIQRVRALLARREMEAHRLDVNDVASDVLRLVRLDANRRGVALDSRLAPDLPSVRGDRVQIQQALLNFLLNGMEAMTETPPGRRRLVVRTARRHDDVEVAVTDTGHGIPPERVNRLFASFFTTKPQGMGLGLSIARSVVEAHGGRAWAENEPGGGATFRFTLPAVGPGDAGEGDRPGPLTRGGSR